MKLFKNTTQQFSRQRREMYYSIAILILIPSAIVISTLFLTSSVRNDYDKELGRKADIVNNVVGIALRDDLDDPEKLQQSVEDIKNSNSEIIRLTIQLPVENSSEYSIVASSIPEEIGTKFVDPRITFALSENRSVSASESINGQKTWGVVTPISQDGEIVGIASINFGFEKVNDLVQQILTRSLYSMVIVVAFVVLLLLNHFKFVEYALLFRKLKEVDQLKNDFLSVATHELKSPMAVIKGSLENIIDGVFGKLNPNAEESIKLALHETDRLADLVTDLLNVSRIEQGRITYKSDPVILQDVISELTERYKEKAQQKGLSIKYESGETKYVITADRGRVLEIFTNLIDNAIKYSEKGEITVAHKLQGNTVRTTVRDTGIGMSAKERENLFSRFYRIQNEKTRRISGTGLGLWIIKQYIEAMKGKIYVDSLEGVGSEFTVEFPLVSEKSATNSKPEKSEN